VLAVLVVLVALAYLLVVRNLPAFRVEAVTVRGAAPAYAHELRSELVRAARGMTTLNVDEAALGRAARGFPAVVSLVVDPELPNRLVITVAERPPVGELRSAPRGTVPVAADGTLLAGQPVDRPLPRLPTGRDPGRREGGRASADVRTAAAIAAGAPHALAAWLGEIRRGRHGWIVRLRRGPELWFGPARDLERKWRAAATVLAAPSARGARYVDLRLPDRPTAGGLTARPRPLSAPPTSSQPPLEALPQP
jgi:cell division protein FtsQ